MRKADSLVQSLAAAILLAEQAAPTTKAEGLLN